MNEVKRAYYPDGSIQAEVTLVDGIPEGVGRQWHPNGILAWEWHVRHGIPEGVGKQWNEKGELLGTFEIKDGTGIQRLWYPNGPVMGEFPWLHGKFNGRSRAFFEDGDLAADTYWLDDKKVSKKRYMEACEHDPELPRYDEPKPPARKTRRNKKTPKQPADPTTPSDEFELQLLAGPAVREALAWLEETREPSRSLGEATGQDESIRFVKELYDLGAVTVHAVEIDGAPTEDQNTGKLVIELPQDHGQRDKLLDFCGELAIEQGFDPVPDFGQRYLFLMLD